MSLETNETTVLENPPVVLENNETPTTPELPTLEYVYQPTDDQGRPMGGKQVIKYKTVEELHKKFEENSIHLLRKLREQTRKNRLGLQDRDEISEESPRITGTLEFKPRELTPEERFRLSRDLLDPEKVDEASDLLFESRFGAKPQEFTSAISELQIETKRLQADSEARIFVANNPDYVVCEENLIAIGNWMIRYNLAPVSANFQLAYDTLKKAGILVEKNQGEFINVDPTGVGSQEIPPAPISPVVTEEPKGDLPISGIPSGFNSSTSDDKNTPIVSDIGSDIVYDIKDSSGKVVRRFTGLSAIRAMPSEEYKHRVKSDPNFVKKEAALEAALAARRK